MKLFRQQLAYYKDIDFSEPVMYMGAEHPEKKEVEEFLTEQALTGL